MHREEEKPQPRRQQLVTNSELSTAHQAHNWDTATSSRWNSIAALTKVLSSDVSAHSWVTLSSCHTCDLLMNLSGPDNVRDVLLPRWLTSECAAHSAWFLQWGYADVSGWKVFLQRWCEVKAMETIGCATTAATPLSASVILIIQWPKKSSRLNRCLIHNVISPQKTEWPVDL